MDIIHLLQKLVEAPGTPGFEEPVRRVMIEELMPYVDTMEVDRLGNLIACKRGSSPNGPKIMLDAHMDEVGLIVKHVLPSGFILFEQNGIVDDRILLAEWVNIHTKKGVVTGTIGVKGRHMLTPQEAASPLSSKDMWIDIGVENDKEAAELGVRPGDPIVFDRGFKVLANGKSVLARCLDDRLGCAIMVQSVKELSKTRHEATVYAVGTVQEEVGARGAATAAYQIQPDIALVYDTGHSLDPAVTPKWSATMMGCGPTIRLMDISRTGRGCITPPSLKELMIRAAEEEGIPYQLDLMSGTFLDSSTITLSREGVPSIGMCVARRNAHSMSELCRVIDIENAVKLTVAFIKRVTKELIDGFTQKIK